MISNQPCLLVFAWKMMGFHMKLMVKSDGVLGKVNLYVFPAGRMCLEEVLSEG